MQRSLGIAAALTIAAVVAPAPAAQAGGHVGLHISSAGFGVTLGFGDWGVYTSGWSDPSWSLSFGSTLHGYGEWVYVTGLGRVWRPWVEAGWRPYTHGRWVLTSYGWTWVAYEPWGYIPHHYGSWARCGYGWVWVPGYSYSPANVVWVQAGGYVGWYARPPRGWSHAAHGYRRGYTHGYGDGYRDGWRDARYATYVDWHHLASDNVSHYAVTHTTATRAHRVSVADAPSAHEVRRRGGAEVPSRNVSRRTVAVDDRQVELVRPEGVARSIERHAATTVQRTLAPAAIERRQPRAVTDDSGHGASMRGSTAAVEDHGRRSRTIRTPVAHSGTGARADVRSGGSRSLPTARTSSSQRTTSPDPVVDRRRAVVDDRGRSHTAARGRAEAVEQRHSRPNSTSNPGRIAPDAQRSRVRASGTAATRSTDRDRATARSTSSRSEASRVSRSNSRRDPPPRSTSSAGRQRPSSPEDPPSKERSKPRRR